MRKLAASVVLLGIAVLGAGVVAAQPYPPGAPTLFLSPGTVAPGGTFTATLDGCLIGETVTFSVEGGASASATCSGTTDAASASATLTAPTAPGTYTVTATGATSGISDSATLTVTGGAGPAPPAPPAAPGAGALPTTGSDSTPIVQIALGALLAGVALVGVAMYRRRTAVSA